MKKKTKIKKKPEACHGCGKHPKLVSDSCTVYFCTYCLENGNYSRFKNNQSLIKLIKHIKNDEILLGANGKPYTIINFEYTFDENNYYLCQEFFGRNGYLTLGDYFFVRKLKIREAKKISDLVNKGINTLNFTYEQELKVSCLNCVHREQNNCNKIKKSLIYCNPETCEHYRLID